MDTSAAVQPIVGVLAASPVLLAEAQAAIAAAVAPVALASTPQRWTRSTYYTAEMGPELWRQYLACDAVMAPEDLGDLKRLTGALEGRWRGPRGRAVNLDPGYLDLLRVVLASTKDAAHRVAIGPGLWGEATLHFVNGTFAPWRYTYPDYASADACAFFNDVRERFRATSKSCAEKFVWKRKAC
jgi:hypothetical protein